LYNQMKKVFAKVSIAIFVASIFFPLFSARTESANLTTLSDTMSRLKEGIASDHEIKFTTPTGAGDATDTIILTFDAGFTVGAVDYTDMDLSHGAATGFETEETLAAAADATKWGASFTGMVLTLTHPTDGTAGDIAASDIIIVQIGQNATGGVANAQLTNPGSDGSKTISIAGTFGDTGSIAVAIMTEDQVTVTATVNPTISSTLSSNSCALGTLSASAINTCNYTNEVSTNAANGYTATIVEDDNLKSATYDIPDENTTGVDQGTEEYGVGTSMDSQDLTHYGDNQGACTSPSNPQGAGSIATAIKYASSASPVSNETTILCHAASITGATTAGNYSQIVTHITTGHF